MVWLEVRRVAGLAAVALVTLGGVTACGSARPGSVAVAVSASAKVSARPESPPPGAPPKFSSRDQDWINREHLGDVVDTEAGDLAAAKATTDGIRSAASKLHDDLLALDTALIKLGLRLDAYLPQHPNLKQERILDALENERGPAFDHDFTGSMMTSQEKLIAATQRELAHGSSPRVLSLARHALSVLHSNLAALRSVAAQG